MKSRRFHFFVILCSLSLPLSSRANIYTSTQLCSSTPATVSSNENINQAAFANCVDTSDSQTQHIITPSSHGPQVFDATASVFADSSTFKVAVDLSLTNYQRSMYQYSSTSDIQATFPTTAYAGVGFSDSLLVTSAGGPGTYSLNYLFSLDGQVTSSDSSLFSSSFCTSLFLPQGTGRQTSRCLNAGESVPQTFTLTYADLPFGAPVTPTISIFAYAFLTPLYSSQVGTAIDTVVTGSAHADFGNTVHLTSLLITDTQGRPISGITLNSDGGYTYPLDPANTATPEPAGLSAVGVALLAWAGLRKHRHLVQ